MADFQCIHGRPIEADCTACDRAPYPAPQRPFCVDADGDICDANGWMIASPAYGVWPDREELARAICAALNAAN